MQEVQSLRVDVSRLEREAAAARGEARAAEARALQLQKQLDALTEYSHLYLTYLSVLSPWYFCLSFNLLLVPVGIPTISCF